MTSLIVSETKVLEKYICPFLGDGASASEVDAKKIDPSWIVANFVDGEGITQAVAICDAAFGAFSGSALTMIPPGQAKKAAASGELNDLMQENLFEVMNLASRLFMDENTSHVKLGKLFMSLKEAPADVQAIANGKGLRGDWKVTMPKYGEGFFGVRVAE